MSLISHRSSSSSFESFEICIIIESSDLEFRYEFFVVDVGRSSESAELGTPIFRLTKDYPPLMSFFGFGSSIYFIFGDDTSTGPLNSNSRSVFVYDSSSSSPGIKLTGSMNRDKCHPLVIGPVNEKYYVLSEYLDRCDFEEFDPKSESWEILSRPCTDNYHHKIHFHKIESYVVVNLKIVIWTKSQMYSYDTSKDEWVVEPYAYSIDRCPFEYGALSIGHDLYFGFTKQNGNYEFG